MFHFMEITVDLIKSFLQLSNRRVAKLRTHLWRQREKQPAKLPMFPGCVSLHGDYGRSNKVIRSVVTSLSNRRVAKLRTHVWYICEDSAQSGQKSYLCFQVSGKFQSFELQSLDYIFINPSLGRWQKVTQLGRWSSNDTPEKMPLSNKCDL